MDARVLRELPRGVVAVVRPGKGIGIVLEIGLVADGKNGAVGEPPDGLERLGLGSFGMECVVELFGGRKSG